MVSKLPRAVIAVIAALVLAAGGAAWAAASASAAPAAIGRCAADNLAVWIYADGADGTAGTTFYHLEYTNIGRSACFLNGFPGVSATALSGPQLGRAAAHDNGVPAKTIDIAPRATAHSVLGYVDIQVDSACKPRNAGFLKVYAPDALRAKRAFFPLAVCTTGRVDLNVRRVQTGL